MNAPAQNCLRPVQWAPAQAGSPVPGRVRLLDQTRLPNDVVFVETDDVEVVWRAIRSLQVRGAPAIGVAAAMGVAAAAQRGDNADAVRAAAESAADRLATSRPTAVNLFWALDRMRATARGFAGADGAALKRLLVDEAQRIHDEDDAMCRAIGRHGLTLLRDGMTILTHCNAGGLATSGFGTALAPVYAALERGWRLAVYADETRPLLQGARLTAWELCRAGVATTVICDNMAATVMRQGRVQAVLVGADRIAANGDTANKIGTYGVAVLARHHGIPFYVLAPSSTFDFACPDGAAIPIEERDAGEIACGFGPRTAPADARVFNPAFDVTPTSLISAIVCEKGVARPDYRANLSAWNDRASQVRAART